MKTREDDQDEAAIDKRHEIYFDSKQGTMAASNFFKDLSKNNGSPSVIELDGKKGVEEVTDELMEKLADL